jgi:hypothetical protein
VVREVGADEPRRAGDQGELIFCERVHVPAPSLFIRFHPKHKLA